MIKGQNVQFLAERPCKLANQTSGPASYMGKNDHLDGWGVPNKLAAELNKTCAQKQKKISKLCPSNAV